MSTMRPTRRVVLATSIAILSVALASTTAVAFRNSAARARSGLETSSTSVRMTSQGASRQGAGGHVDGSARPNSDKRGPRASGASDEQYKVSQLHLLQKLACFSAQYVETYVFLGTIRRVTSIDECVRAVFQPDCPVCVVRDPMARQLHRNCGFEGWKRLSESVLWSVQTKLYDGLGSGAWGNLTTTVPYFVTTNAFVGAAYARSVRGFLRDLYAAGKLDTNHPVYLIELGAGSGKFAYNFLHEWADFKATPGFDPDWLTYVMTDFTENNIQAWGTLRGFARHVRSGRLDFSKFDATRDTMLRLRHSGALLRARSVVNPMVAIFNYVFDTLPADAFQVRRGLLREMLASAGSERKCEEAITGDPELLSRMSVGWNTTIPVLNKYGNVYPSKLANNMRMAQHLNAVLDWYVEYYSDQMRSAGIQVFNGEEEAREGGSTIDHKPVAEDVAQSTASFLIPVGGIRAIQVLMDIADSNLMILSGDKGHTRADFLWGFDPPSVAKHVSFSLMANYHAIGLWFASLGGSASCSNVPQSSLQVCSFLSLRDSNARNARLSDLKNGPFDAPGTFVDLAQRSPLLAEAFQDSAVWIGPNEFFHLQSLARRGEKHSHAMAPMSPVAIAALLRAAKWEPDLAYKLKNELLRLSSSPLSPRERHLLVEAVQNALSRFVRVATSDWPFEAGRVLYNLGENEAAIAAFEMSIADYGEHHATLRNLGVALYDAGRLRPALVTMERAKDVKELELRERRKSGERGRTRRDTGAGAAGSVAKPIEKESDDAADAIEVWLQKLRKEVAEAEERSFAAHRMDAPSPVGANTAEDDEARVRSFAERAAAAVDAGRSAELGTSDESARRKQPPSRSNTGQTDEGLSSPAAASSEGADGDESRSNAPKVQKSRMATIKRGQGPQQQRFAASQAQGPRSSSSDTDASSSTYGTSRGASLRQRPSGPSFGELSGSGDRRPRFERRKGGSHHREQASGRKLASPFGARPRNMPLPQRDSGSASPPIERTSTAASGFAGIKHRGADGRGGANKAGNVAGPGSVSAPTSASRGATSSRESEL